MKRKVLLVVLFLFGIVCPKIFRAETVPTLEQITDIFNNNSTLKSYSDAGIKYEATAEKNGILIKIISTDLNYEFNFELEGTVLTSKELSTDEKSFSQAVVALFLTDAVGQFHGYKEGDLYQTLNSEEVKNFKVEKDGFETGEENGYSYVKIDISKKIKLADFSDVYITVEDLEHAKEYINGEGFSSGNHGNIYYSQNGYDNEKEIFVGEKDKVTNNTYKSLISILSVIFDEDLINEFKTKYKSVEDTVNYLGISVERNPKMSEGDLDNFKGYDTIKASFNISNVKKEYAKSLKQKSLLLYGSIICGVVLIVVFILFIVKRRKKNVNNL